MPRTKTQPCKAAKKSKASTVLSKHPHYEFTYHRKGDVLDARPLARRIKRAMDTHNKDRDCYNIEFTELRHSVYALTLCAGNQLVPDAPLDMQYLSAAQRISDYFGAEMILAPAEVSRNAALCSVDRQVERVVSEFEEAVAQNDLESSLAEIPGGVVVQRRTKKAEVRA